VDLKGVLAVEGGQIVVSMVVRDGKAGSRAFPDDLFCGCNG